jgi:hypothetical protein
MAREAVEKYLLRVTEDPLLKAAGFRDLRRKLLQEGGAGADNLGRPVVYEIYGYSNDLWRHSDYDSTPWKHYDTQVDVIVAAGGYGATGDSSSILTALPTISGNTTTWVGMTLAAGNRPTE